MINYNEIAQLLTATGVFLTGVASIMKEIKKKKPSTKKQKAKKQK